MKIATPDTWYETTSLEDGVTHVHEPFIKAFLRCGMLVDKSSHAQHIPKVWRRLLCAGHRLRSLGRNKTPAAVVTRL